MCSKDEPQKSKDLLLLLNINFLSLHFRERDRTWQDLALHIYGFLIPWKGKCWQCIIYVRVIEQAFSQAYQLRNTRTDKGEQRKEKCATLPHLYLTFWQYYYQFFTSNLSNILCKKFNQNKQILGIPCICWKVWKNIWVFRINQARKIFRQGDLGAAHRSDEKQEDLSWRISTEPRPSKQQNLPAK